MKQKLTLALLLSFCALASVAAQTKPTADNDDVVRITSNLVQVDVVVTKDGKPVTNLNAEDFEIYEDGKRQNITNFAFISNVPRNGASAPDKADRAETTVPDAPPGPVKPDVPHRTIAVVVDDLGLSLESMNGVRKQLQKFVAEQLQPNDLVAIVRTSGEIGTLQQLTNDRRLLARAVDQLRWNVCSRMGITVFPRNGQVGIGFDWDSCIPDYESERQTKRALHIVLDGLARLPGRKSLIFMSDDLPFSREDWVSAYESAISVGAINAPGPESMNRGDDLKRISEKAIRGSVVIYSVDTQGLQYTGQTAADNAKPPRFVDPNFFNAVLRDRFYKMQKRKEGAEVIARLTGGFQVTNSNGFQLDRILEDQSGYYLLGYRPNDETFNRKFHQIKAKVTRSGMSARTRSGFFGVSEEEIKKSQPTSLDENNLALISPFAARDLELNLTSFFANSKPEGSVVRSFIYLDAANLTFTLVNDRHETSLELHGVIFGENGAVEEQLKHTAVLSLRENEYQQALRDGLRLRLDMPAKHPGSYQVRIAVRDAVSMKIGSAGQFVAVPDLKTKQLALSGVVLRDEAEAASQTAVMAAPATRRLPVNSDLRFSFVVYNANPNLVLQARLVRDGKIVKTGPQIAIDVAKQKDLDRLFVTSALPLSPDLEPGSYYLQVTITDRTAKTKQPPVIKWVDFEIVK